MDALEWWFTDNGGFFHPSVVLASDALHGTHFRAQGPIQPGTHVLTVPHHLALSHLNALVDDEFPVFKTHAKAFTVEALTFFYLMAQWINKEKSFWEPYLDHLPTPEQGFGTPLWFDEEDRKWLEGTDLHSSLLKREEIWQQYWRDGVDVLKSAGMDTSEYTWNLFKWAATVYTSRSFNSQTVQPQDSKYWTAYKHTRTGRQTVLLDLSNFSSDWKDFSVLFPVMDAGNHNPLAKVDWAYDPGHFSLTVSEPIALNDQIFNNYGPKGNDELLMGYGFCSPHNPNDGALLTLRAPPLPLQDLLRRSHPGYIDVQSGMWNPKATTFRLLRSLLPSKTSEDSPSAIWKTIPPALAELLTYTIRYERGLPPIVPISDDDDSASTFSISSPITAHYLPRIAFYISAALTPKLAALTQSNASLPSIPTNPRQANAKLYRDAQIDVLSGVHRGLTTYLQSLLPKAPPSVKGGRTEYTSGIWTLEQVMDVLEVEAPEAWMEIYAGMKWIAGTSKMKKLRGSEREGEVWGVLLCFVYLYVEGLKKEQQGGNEAEEEEGMLEKWVRGLETEYGRPSLSASRAENGDGDEEMGDEHGTDSGAAEEEAGPTLASIKTAASNLPGSLWTSPAWTADFLLDWGVRIAKSQGTYMDVGHADEEAEEDVRFVVYLHVEERDVEVCEI